uniref:Probable RNA polymerase II nuclear localization protein SLC7A6OS n=1 Tax=Rhodnius prolixus TaxID=13249 RepID=T1IGG0_RHOPR
MNKLLEFEHFRDGDIKKHINEINSVKRKSVKFREHSVSAVTEKLRSENKSASHSNRLKVVNWFRAVGDEGEVIGEDETYTVVDVVNTEKSSCCNAITEVSSDRIHSAVTEEQYVYDLYYSAVGGDFNDLQMENLLSVHAVNEELIFGDFMEDREEDSVDEDEDSNDENHWRNDYPDEMSDDDSSRSSIDEDLMRLALQMKKVAVDDDYRSDLSSDEEDELLVYNENEDPYYYDRSDSSQSESSFSYYSTD